MHVETTQTKGDPTVVILNHCRTTGEKPWLAHHARHLPPLFAETQPGAVESSVCHRERVRRAGKGQARGREQKDP